MPYSTAEIGLLTLNLNINLVILVLSWPTFLSHHLIKSGARVFSILQLSVWVRQYYILHPNHQHRNNFSADLASQLTCVSLPESRSLTETSLQKSDTRKVFMYYIIITFLFKSFILTRFYYEMESANWLGFSPISC